METHATKKAAYNGVFQKRSNRLIYSRVLRALQWCFQTLGLTLGL